MMTALIWVAIAVVLGRMGQLYMTYQQSMSYNRDVRRLRASGVVSAISTYWKPSSIAARAARAPANA